MRAKRWMVHAVFECEDCGKTWEWYMTAQDNARKHAEKHGHRVSGETGFAVKYDGTTDRKDCDND